MNVGLLAEAIRLSENNPWWCVTIRGNVARVEMLNGEVRSAVGIRELKKVLGANTRNANCKNKR